MINNKKVLVIGDVILDVWTYAKAVGLSLETPTLKSKLIEKKHTFGGSANVVSNLKELGADITFLTLLGDDEYTKTYESIKDIKLHSVVEDDRKNTIKERFWIERGGSNYKHLQVNVIDNKSIKKESIDKMIKNIEDTLDDKFDVVMLIDYRHGLFTKDFLNRLMPVLNKKSIPIVVIKFGLKEFLANCEIRQVFPTALSPRVSNLILTCLSPRLAIFLYFFYLIFFLFTNLLKKTK